MGDEGGGCVNTVHNNKTNILNETSFHKTVTCKTLMCYLKDSVLMSNVNSYYLMDSDPHIIYFT